MNRVRQFFENLGLSGIQESVLPYTYDTGDYKNTDQSKVDVHKALLKEIEKREDNRLEIIDAKTSQVITYTGIIFSALSLFIPILLDKIPDQHIIIKVLFVILLGSAFAFYILTIHNAIRNYNVKKFMYSGSHPNNVIKYQDKSVAEFTSIEVKDLLHGINQNLKTNNEKATNLIHAFHAFRTANIMTALLGIVICISLLFAKPKTESTVKNSVKIEDIDSIIIKVLSHPALHKQDKTELPAVAPSLILKDTSDKRTTQ